MTEPSIGLIGLGVMGANLALNIAEKGFPVAVANRTAETTRRFHAEAGELAKRIVPCATVADLVAALTPPRTIIVMVKAGEAVDAQIAELRPHLSRGDTIVDAGNANFRDTLRRDATFQGSGLNFIGMGVSGGEEGARHGPSIMAGGPQEAYLRIAPVLEAISAKYQDTPCCAWTGPDGAGHFVKMIHNGIEYADMQMIAEVYGLLRDGAGMAAGEIADVFAAWNAGPLNSYLIEITAGVLAVGDETSGRPLVDVILDRAGQKGTGRWTVMEAQALGVPATTIEAAVAARALSAAKDERMRASAAYGAHEPPRLDLDRAVLIGRLEAGLYAGKIAAYAQGFAVLEAASAEYGWHVPLATTARIWRAGCIIRSQFLDRIASAFEAARGKGNLLLAPDFVAEMTRAHPALRSIVALAAATASPVPALSSALAYFDGYRQGRGTANLIQAQRDFFGAHGFERIGEAGNHHGPWSKK
jgi:6-phosphogluconate dehydrogenase